MNINKKVLTLGSFCLLMLCGCSSKEDDLTSSAQHDLIEPNPVKIELSSQAKELVSASTRAALTGSEDMDINGIGIFGLARERQTFYSDRDDIDALTKWTWNSESEDRSCILYNVQSNKEGTDIVWNDQSAIYFYPITQVYAYDFYGYYPYVDPENDSDDDEIENDGATGKKVTAVYKIDGTRDLLWGRSNIPNDAGGVKPYCARWFRANAANHASKPNILLQHLLTRFVFSVVPGENYDDAEAYTEAVVMQVKDVRIKDVNNYVKVTIVDFDNQNLTIAERIEVYGGTKEDFILKDENGDPISDHPVDVPDNPNNPTRVGESIMLYPDTQYKLQITLSLTSPNEFHNTERDFVTEVPLYLEPLAENNTFLPGCSYNVKIVVHGPREVELSSTLQQWTVEEGPEIEL